MYARLVVFLATSHLSYSDTSIYMSQYSKEKRGQLSVMVALNAREGVPKRVSWMHVTISLDCLYRIRMSNLSS